MIWWPEHNSSRSCGTSYLNLSAFLFTTNTHSLLCRSSLQSLSTHQCKSHIYCKSERLPSCPESWHIMAHSLSISLHISNQNLDFHYLRHVLSSPPLLSTCSRTSAAFVNRVTRGSLTCNTMSSLTGAAEVLIMYNACLMHAA